MATTQATSTLKAWRTNAGLTLAEMADLTGYSTAMLSRVERGERTLSTWAKVAIARRLQVRIVDLFDVEP